MRDDTKNAEEAVIEAPVEQEESVYDWLDLVLFNKTPVEQEESVYDWADLADLADWVDWVIAEYELQFDAWVIEGVESPVLCIRAIRGDKVSGTAYLNATTPHRQSVRYAIQSIIKEVIRK